MVFFTTRALEVQAPFDAAILVELRERRRVDLRYMVHRADDYLLVRLTDRHAILDPMGKLRAVYPNVLHLEKPGMLEAKGRQQLDRERLAFSALDMFSDFFAQTSGEPMSDAQARAMGELITTLSREQEGQA